MTRALLLLLLPAASFAQPDLKKQDAWGDKEKKEFLQYLRSGQAAAPAGDVKNVKMEGVEDRPSPPKKPFFLTTTLSQDTIITVAGNGSLLQEGSAVGPKILMGGHIFTWLRYYVGGMYTRFRQEKLDGSRPLVTHYQVPAGFELALIPLGTPHTRYLILRGGTAIHNFAAPGQVSSDFRTPLLGWQTTFNAGLGYEWQIADSLWRVHGLVEGYKSMIRQGNTARFYGLGFTFGVVRTF